MDRGRNVDVDTLQWTAGVTRCRASCTRGMMTGAAPGTVTAALYRSTCCFEGAVPGVPSPRIPPAALSMRTSELSASANTADSPEEMWIKA